jgi:hypothetical protein
MDGEAADDEDRLLDEVERSAARIAVRADSYAELLVASAGHPGPALVVSLAAEFSGIAC